ncbi:MAG: valine--tRNA ligase [Candidatus Aenigmarchaeota archaeon]|nr:valine--tRNA ligase [Candidatus Aenigmarchaeota archaeon]
MPLEPRIKEKQWTKELELPLVEEFRHVSHAFNTKSKKIFSIDTPPPYPSGKWHIGAVAHYALIDMIARAQRMLGRSVLFPWGVDRNGINIELLVEKKYGKPLHAWDREEFIELCRKEIASYTKDLENTARRVGMSCAFENAYYTDSPEYRAASQAAFIELWNKGLVVEDLRPNNYCTDCRTTIADAEVYYVEKDTKLVHVVWETEDGDKVTIATTRPELMCACQVVLVNPDDERYARYHGKKIKLPLYDRSVVVRAHPYVDPAYGTGAMMICSYGDVGDVQLFRELRLEPIAAIGVDARMTDASGRYKGFKIKEARERVTEDLKSAGLVVKEETVKHKVPTCERSKTPLEIINMKEWYLKQTNVLDALRERAKEMAFFPDKHRQLLLDWIDNVTIDWPISRRRYYHTEIPIWYCTKCNEPHAPEPGPYYQPWRQKAPFAHCTKCKTAEFVGEERVFDTWMDSSISNLYIVGYPKIKEGLFPVTLRTQGRDIVRTWLYYTTLKSHLLMNSKPFERVWITGMGLDEHGKKMSKSLGNVVDPDVILEKYGADAFRLWAASETNVGEDYRVSTERIEGAYKSLVKLWNVARFVSQFEAPARKPTLTPLDSWIINEANALVTQARQAYENYDFHNPAVEQRHFLWETFASHYLELVKPRAYNESGVFTNDERDAARWALNYVVDLMLLLLAPISPFITYKLYEELHGANVHAEKLPVALDVSSIGFETRHLLEVDGAIWKHKKDKGLNLKSDVQRAVLPKALRPLEKDLKAAHNIKTLEWGDALETKLE